MELTRITRIAGIVLAVLLLLASINSTYFFLGMLKVKFIEWFVFNACAPSSVAYLIGLTAFFITKNKKWLAIAILPIFFFGTMGLFIFPWDGMNLIAQVSHIIMTLNIAWALFVILKSADYKALRIGLLISVLVFVPFIAFQQYYCRIHADDLMRILQIN